MSNLQHQVQVPDEYFAKAKSEYSDWRWAFIREIIQNSYDAGSANLHFKMWKNSDGDCVVKCLDDGSGMDKDTLLNVFLALGGSKKLEGSVGGFGWAKNLIAFSHKRYQIWSKDTLIDGKGGRYNVLQSPTVLPRGTEVLVVMSEESYATSMLGYFENLLRTYVRYLNTDRDFTIHFNGEALKPSPADFQYAVDTGLGKLRFNDASNNTVSLVVTVHGLPMFRHSEFTADRGLNGMLELTGVSYEVLTSNRENFRGDLRAEFSNLIRKMASDRFSLKRKPTLDIGFNSKLAALTKVSEFTLENDHYPHDFLLRVSMAPTVGSDAKKFSKATSSVVDETLKLFKKTWVRKLAHTWKFYILAVLSCEYARSTLKATISYKDVVGTDTSIDTICHLVKLEGVVMKDENDKVIVPGFITDPELEGVNHPHSEEMLRAILVNPAFFDEGFWHGDVLDLVFHEVAHLGASGHCDAFVDTEMQLRKSFRRTFKEDELRQAAKAYLKDLTAKRRS